MLPGALPDGARTFLRSLAVPAVAWPTLTFRSGDYTAAACIGARVLVLVFTYSKRVLVPVFTYSMPRVLVPMAGDGGE